MAKRCRRRTPAANVTRGASPLRQPRDFRCYRDRDGRQHFNFAQRLWLQPAVRMACTRTSSTAVITLALNVLALAMPATRLVSAGRTRRALLLARAFSEDCLLSAPDSGWVIPRSAVTAWLQSRSRSGRRPRRRE